MSTLHGVVVLLLCALAIWVTVRLAWNAGQRR